MINNRLFKKINAIFWGILTWLPLVIFVLAIFLKGFIVQLDWQAFISGDFTLSDYFSSVCSGALDILSNDGAFEMGFWYNPLSDVFSNLFNGIFDTVEPGPFYSALNDMCAWVCWVQVMRLFTYVFYWFIDLINGLFDLITFNRKGDN